MNERRYYYCDKCQQIRMSWWIENGKCTRCETTVRFIKDNSIPRLDEATMQELLRELARRGRGTMSVKL